MIFCGRSLDVHLAARTSSSAARRPSGPASRERARRKRRPAAMLASPLARGGAYALDVLRAPLDACAVRALQAVSRARSPWTRVNERVTGAATCDFRWRASSGMTALRSCQSTRSDAPTAMASVHPGSSPSQHTAHLLRLYDTATRGKRLFVPGDPSGRRVTMYVCGVTVYDFAHIGHARAAVVYDVLLRTLLSMGHDVTYVRNFTDVDDKIIRRAAREGVSEAELSQRFIDEFHADVDALGCLPPTLEPRATSHVEDMVHDTEAILRNGHGYAVGGDVFFDVGSLTSYGALSGRRPTDNRAGERVAVDARKRSPEDFALWKGAGEGEPSWPSPWGPGRPGWHIECSAMIRSLLGDVIDIHGGGQDLIFPHHENERAQALAAEGRGRRERAERGGVNGPSEGKGTADGCCGGSGQTASPEKTAASGEPAWDHLSPPAAAIPERPALARYWVHNGFVIVGEEKMSKSLGNFVTIREVLAQHHPAALRWMLLATHYRSAVAFSPRQLEEAADRVYAVGVALAGAQDAGISASRDGRGILTAAARQALLDDLGTPGVVAAVAAPLRRANEALKKIAKAQASGNGKFLAGQRKTLSSAVDEIAGASDALGLNVRNPHLLLAGLRDAALRRSGLSEWEVEVAIVERAEARARRDWAAADAARAELEAKGLAVMDGPQGTTWRPLPILDG